MTTDHDSVPPIRPPTGPLTGPGPAGFASVGSGGDREPRFLLLALYRAALDAVGGRSAVGRALAAAPLAGPVWMIALGKAAAAMTLGALDVLGTRCLGGLVIDKALPDDPAPFAAAGIEVLTGGHPLPTGESLAAGRRLIEVLGVAPPGATLLFLLSGGASSLAEVPAAGLGLADLEHINRWLLGSGLPIGSVNRVRIAVSRIKGGGLLAVLPPRPLRVLAISDVPGDDPGLIGSGPLVPAHDLAAALAGLPLPPWLRAVGERGLAGRAAMRSAGLAVGPPVELVATLDLAKTAAATAALEAGLRVLVHPLHLDGDAAVRGRELARSLRSGQPGVQIWGGETTVRLPEHPGRGGRNQHLALAAARELAGRADLMLLAAGTDGSDGPGEDAGALVDGGTLTRAAAAGLDAADCLARADSGTLLAASGDLLRTGPTGTNVTDLVLGLRLGWRRV